LNDLCVVESGKKSKLFNLAQFSHFYLLSGKQFSVSDDGLYWVHLKYATDAEIYSPDIFYIIESGDSKFLCLY